MEEPGGEEGRKKVSLLRRWCPNLLFGYDRNRKIRNESRFGTQPEKKGQLFIRSEYRREIEVSTRGGDKISVRGLSGQKRNSRAV